MSDIRGHCIGLYSHLSNKRGGTFIDFEKKIHPPRTFPPSTFIDFLDFFHPPLHVYCIYVLVFSKKSHPPRLFQPPRLLILQLLHSLHVYSNLHGYQRDESTNFDFLPIFKYAAVLRGKWSFYEPRLHLFWGELATIGFLAICAQTSQEGIKCTKAKEQLRAYCRII